MNQLLLVCRSVAGLSRLKAIRPGTPAIVASDDSQVHLAAKSDSRVTSVCFIEKAEPFYSVASDVLRILDRIDAWLNRPVLPAGISPETLRWTRNVEGGLMAQRVQDALLLIDSYRDLIAMPGITEVWIAEEPECRWLDSVLAACALSLGVPCRRVRLRPFAHVRRCVASIVRPFAIAAYRTVNVVRLGGGGFRRQIDTRELDGAAAFLLATSLPKHVENVAPLMLALQRLGGRTIALCWAASERRGGKTAAEQLAGAGLEAIEIERAVTWRDLAASILLAARMAFRTGRTWRTAPGLECRGVRLNGLLAESARHFLVAELPQRIQFERALARVLGNARPAALKPWAPEFFEGRTALRLLPDRRSTLVFHYWLGASLPWPYSDAQGKIDVFLAKGPREAEVAAASYGLSERQIETVGHGRFDSLVDHARRTPPGESRRRLGLPERGARFIGFDPNAALRGFQSVREQVEMTQVILEACRRCPGLVAVVKPHPAYPIDRLLPLFQAAALPNVVVIPGDAPVNDFLNAADIMVTKYSTLLLEAALIGRVAVSALFDGEGRFDLYSGLSAVVWSPGELLDLLLRAAHPQDFAPWEQARLEQQRRSLPLHYFQEACPAAELSADALYGRMSKARVPAPVP